LPASITDPNSDWIEKVETVRIPFQSTKKWNFKNPKKCQVQRKETRDLARKVTGGLEPFFVCGAVIDPTHLHVCTVHREAAPGFLL
jgi:hypothetical protein